MEWIMDKQQHKLHCSDCSNALIAGSDLFVVLRHRFHGIADILPDISI